MFDFKKTYQLPFDFEIPNYSKVYLNQNNFFKRYLKYLKRYIFLLIMRQNNLELKKITDQQKRILWINISAPSIGDTLMDLSSRVLLKGKNIDLYTNEANSSIYTNDKFISNIFISEKSVINIKYDLVILDSYSSRSLKIKKNVAPLTPYVSMFGYYNGPEVNRVLFSFFRMNQLLNYPNKNHLLSNFAKCSLNISSHDVKIVTNLNLPEKFISIVIGGEWPYRTYQNWISVIDEIFRLNKKINIVLIGSSNGNSSAQFIMQKFSSQSIQSCVSRFTFNQTAQIIKQSKIVLCCDGGLMHAANGVNTPIIPLFARLTDDMQLTAPICSFPLYDKTNVNNISVDRIVAKYTESINKLAY